METKVKVIRIVKWIYPYYGNKHTVPYGKLEVSDGTTTKVVKTLGDTVETHRKYRCQYIMFKRKPYKIVTFYEGKTKKIDVEPLY